MSKHGKYQAQYYLNINDLNDAIHYILENKQDENFVETILFLLKLCTKPDDS